MSHDVVMRHICVHLPFGAMQVAIIIKEYNVFTFDQSDKKRIPPYLINVRQCNLIMMVGISKLSIRLRGHLSPEWKFLNVPECYRHSSLL